MGDQQVTPGSQLMLQLRPRQGTAVVSNVGAIDEEIKLLDERIKTLEKERDTALETVSAKRSADPELRAVFHTWKALNAAEKAAQKASQDKMMAVLAADNAVRNAQVALLVSENAELKVDFGNVKKQLDEAQKGISAAKNDLTANNATLRTMKNDLAHHTAILKKHNLNNFAQSLDKLWRRMGPKGPKASAKAKAQAATAQTQENGNKMQLSGEDAKADMHGKSHPVRGFNATKVRTQVEDEDVEMIIGNSGEDNV